LWCQWLFCNAFVPPCVLNGTRPTQMYTPSLHDALPISGHIEKCQITHFTGGLAQTGGHLLADEIQNLRVVLGDLAELGITDFRQDRKSTRLNSSHVKISYAVFCLKKKRGTACGLVREYR